MRPRPGGIGSDELDGTPGRPMGPAFSTPYQERIKAARSNSSRSAPVQQTSQKPADVTADDPTEALKRFLFSGPAASGPSPAPNGYSSDHYTPAQPTTIPPKAPVSNGTQDGRSNNLQAMEDDLRRILKLDLAPGRTAHEQRLFS